MSVSCVQHPLYLKTYMGFWLLSIPGPVGCADVDSVMSFVPVSVDSRVNFGVRLRAIIRMMVI